MAGVAVHDISFRGLAGAIFGVLAVALILLVVGLASAGWNITYNENGTSRNVGLWETCVCTSNNDVADWHKATQAMITIGLIFLVFCCICVFIYMCIHTLSKNKTIMALTALCFLTALFLLIGIIIWGVKMPSNLHWSFALTIIAMLTTIVAGVLSIVQMRKAGVDP
ncbi:unnamed protein product [Owenia fusiformis]|uniref:Uncharacterized protein n=1 Tax=Owenia fusiformis TaxID=6347 RepID=A0A8S4PP46_OWEFU|nr:unnamed protein product [Owenia fusiformis]